MHGAQAGDVRWAVLGWFATAMAALHGLMPVPSYGFFITCQRTKAGRKARLVLYHVIVWVPQ